MDENAADVVELKRASNTALRPAGTQHEMLDNQLAVSAKEIGEGFPPLWPVKDVGLVDLDPW